MSVKIISVKCPDCGAVLTIEEDREQAICSYCGAKVLIHNENEYVVRHIDEAGVRRAETDRLVRMKQLELMERERAEAQRARVLGMRVSSVLAAVGALMIVGGSLAGRAAGPAAAWCYTLAKAGSLPLIGGAGIGLHVRNRSGRSGEKAKVPSSISDYERKNYSAIEDMFRIAGFTDVRCVPLSDLTIGVLKKPGTVESITINGNRITSGGKHFPKNATVVISYHSLSR